MTKRLYYDDAYTIDFAAQVVGRLDVDDRPAVVLDRTYFYPTGGGQPADMGTLGGVEILDVFPREEDGEVLHLLGGQVAGDSVQCRVDWQRRFDHMQHHTGQHVLSQAFIQVARANTVGFHLSADSVTIDLDATGISDEMLGQVEDLANRIVYEDRPVTARLLTPDEEAEFRMRKTPDHLATDGLRVVDIEDFDATACGGTHVARTGEIGVIKVLKLERRGEKTRVEFRCGWRALRDYRDKNALANQLAAEFTVGTWEVDQAVARLRDDLKEARRALKEARTRLLDGEASALLEAAAERGGLRLVRAAFDGREAGEVRELVSRLREEPATIALLGTSGDKAQLILARSDGLPHDMAAVLERALAVLGSDRGGGRPEFAQGGGLAADVARVSAALEEAERAVLEGRP